MTKRSTESSPALWGPYPQSARKSSASSPVLPLQVQKTSVEMFIVSGLFSCFFLSLLYPLRRMGRHFDGEKHVDGHRLPQIERVLPREARIGVSSKLD